MQEASAFVWQEKIHETTRTLFSDTHLLVLAAGMPCNAAGTHTFQIVFPPIQVSGSYF